MWRKRFVMREAICHVSLQDSAQVARPNPGQGRYSIFTRYMGTWIALCRRFESAEGCRLLLDGANRCCCIQLHQPQRAFIMNPQYLRTLIYRLQTIKLFYQMIYSAATCLHTRTVAAAEAANCTSRHVFINSPTLASMLPSSSSRLQSLQPLLELLTSSFPWV